MADLFSGLFGGLTGQQPTPQSTIIDTRQMLQGGLNQLQDVTPQLNTISGQLGAGMTKNQLANESTIFGPSANQLQQQTYSSILDQLKMGESLSPELTNDITRKLYESGAASGFGASSAGRGNVILQTGLEGEKRGMQRRNEALNAVGLLPSSRSQYNPNPLDVLGQGEALGNDIREVQQAKDDYANEVQQIKANNFTSLLNTGAKLLGIGASLGTSAATGGVLTNPISGFGRLFGRQPLGESGGFPTATPISGLF